MKKTNNLYCIVGKSGTGKTTLALELEKLGFAVVESYTTRKPRFEGEKGHIFITEEEFDTLNLITKVEFDGNKYGVTSELLDKADIFVVDPEGLRILKEQYNNKKIVSIYLDCPDNIIQQRMLQRGDSCEAVKQRTLNDKDKFSLNASYDFLFNTAETSLEEEVEYFVKYVVTS